MTTKPGAPVVVEADGTTSSEGMRSYELDGVFEEDCGTHAVYAAVGQTLVESVLDGVNATMLCYGMTGSGKTYTMLGEKGRTEGIVSMAASHLLEAAAASNGAIIIECAFMQLYGSVATDLLVAESPALRIIRRGGEVLVESQSRRTVSMPADVANLVAEGITRRKVSSQRLNSASSRSHAVLTFFVHSCEGAHENADANENAADDGEEGETVAMRTAKLVCVDLAGSERVKESGVTGTTLKEAQAINLSLFHLIRVVQALNERVATPSGGGRQGGSKTEGAAARVPYADSPLTLLLSDALGGNSQTALVATLSPSQEHASQTSATASFASACRGVRNSAARTVARRVPRSRPWAGADSSAELARRKEALLQAEGAAAKQLPWTGVQPGDALRCPGGRREVVSGISCLVYGPAEAANAPRGVALAMHGNPSEAEAMAWLAPALVHAGYVAVCVDMPGFGDSAPAAMGARMGTRSEQACDPGGPAEVVARVLKALGARSATMLGYDWGGGIALAMAASSQFKRLVERVVCMHPAFAKERVADELKAVQAPTLVMWAEDNAFHSWAKFRPLAAKLRQRLGEGRYAEHRTRRESDAAWSAAARSRSIVKFLTGLDPLPEAQLVVARPVRAALAANGAAITRSDGVVFRADVTEQMVRGANVEAEACAELVRAERSGELAALLRDLAGSGGHARAAAMARFARGLPLLDDATMTPARLEELGLWSAAARAAAEALQERVAGTPRYFQGRRVLVPETSGLGSCLGVLHAVDPAADQALVSRQNVPRGGGGQRGGGEPLAEAPRAVSVSWRALLRLNQRHLLPSSEGSDGSQVLRLEDGLWADFASPLLRAELARVALALDDIFARNVAVALEAADDNEALDRSRAAAVVAMRSCLDVTSFARAGGAERGRDRERYAKDDVAKMAAHGEGHCRTCSSCFAPFLWAFADLLGIDPHYCTDAGGRHQWLQFEARPSMRSFACDVYRDEGAFQTGQVRGAFLAEPVESAYTRDKDDADGFFPRDDPLELSGRCVGSAPLQPTDVADFTSPLASAGEAR